MYMYINLLVLLTKFNKHKNANQQRLFQNSSKSVPDSHQSHHFPFNALTQYYNIM